MTAATTNQITLRPATRADVPVIVGMLADDPPGSTRERFETPLPDCYLQAFEVIEQNPGDHLLVAERDGTVLGALQLTIIQYLTYQRRKRALVEGVRVHRMPAARSWGG